MSTEHKVHDLPEGLLRATATLASDVRKTAVARAVGDRCLEGKALSRLGAQHWVAGRIVEALTVYEQALTVAREEGNRNLEGHILGSRAVVHEEQGKLAEYMMSIRWTPTVLRKLGWNRKTIKPGDELTVIYIPHKQKATVGALVRLKVNGKTVAIAPPELEKELDVRSEIK